MKLSEITSRLENAKKYLDNTADQDLHGKLIELESGSNIGNDVREALKAIGFPLPQNFYSTTKSFHSSGKFGANTFAERTTKHNFLSWIDTELTKIKELKTRFPNQERELGFENGKIYDVRIKTAQEEADRALKSVGGEIDKTPVSDRQKLDQLNVRYRSLETAKTQLGELNEQFATNPSALNPAELRRVTESVKEFASNPKLTSADQVSYAKAAVPSGAQAASAETPTTASGLKPTSASLLRPQDTAGATVSASKPSTFSAVEQAAAPNTAARPSSGNVPTPVASGAQAASAENPSQGGNFNASEALRAKLKNYPELINRETARLNKVRTDLEAAKNEAALKRAEAERLKTEQAGRNTDTSQVSSVFNLMNNMFGLKSDVEKQAEAAEEKVKQYERDIQFIPTEIERLKRLEAEDKESLKKYDNSNRTLDREIQSGNIPKQSPQVAAAEEIANQRAAQKGLGTFTASKDDTVLEALPPNLLIKLYDSLNQPHVDYGQSLIPNMDPAEINGMRKLNDLVNQGDPESIALLNELKQNQPEKFNTFQTVRNILQDTKLSPEDKERFLRSSAELTGQGASPVTAQDTQPYDKSMEALRERLRNRIFEDFKKNDLRKFQDMFTGNQAYFGSRRKEIEKDLMQSLQEKLADVDASLGVQGEQKAYDRALADKMRKLQAASQLGGLNAQTANTALASNAQDIARAQALNASSLAERQQELMRQNLRKALAHDSTLTGLRANEAMMQAGGVQRKNQEEINKDKYRQFMDKVNHQRNSAIAMLDAARGYQMAPTNMPMMNAATVNSNLMASAQPQQVYNASNNGMFGAAANLMGSLDKALNPQNLPRFKSGGVVKRPAYAVGGSVADDIMRQKRALIAKQMAQPPVDPYQQFMGNAQDVSNQLMNRAQNPGSPSGAFLRDYGANLMAADPSKTATQQVGEALKSGHAAYDNAEAQPMRDYESALKVQQVMHNTKTAVDEFKANQAIKKEELALRRQDKALKQQMMMGGLGGIQTDSQGNPIAIGGKFTPNAKMEAGLNKDYLKEAEADIKVIKNINLRLNSLENVAKKVDSGKVRKYLYDYTTPGLASIGSKGTGQDYEALETESNALVGELERMNSGSRLAVARLNLLTKSKMGLHLSKDTNLKIINELRYQKDMVSNRAQFIQNAYKHGVPAWDASNAYNQYIDDVLSGNENTSPLNYLEGVDPNKMKNIKVPKLDSYTSLVDKHKILSDEQLINLSNDNNEQHVEEKTLEQQNVSVNQYTEDDVRDYAQKTGISLEEARKLFQQDFKN